MILKYLLLLIITTSCHKTQPELLKNQSENSIKSKIQKTEIEQIIIKHFGGRSFNDSIVYLINNNGFEFHVYSKNKEKSSSKVKELEEGIFTYLTNKIDLSDFKEIKNGKSFQETDGYDTEIRIITKSDTISKINGFKNQNWDIIYNFFTEFQYN